VPVPAEATSDDPHLSAVEACCRQDVCELQFECRHGNNLSSRVETIVAAVAGDVGNGCDNER
jgi:hypothetical protein